MGGDQREKRQLGRILLRKRLVSTADLDELLETQKSEPGARLASAVVRSGKVGEVEMLQALSEQHGVPGIDLAQVVIPLEHLRWVPEGVAKANAMLPFLVNEERVFVAMADPEDRRLIETMEYAGGRSVLVYVALYDALMAAITSAYGRFARGEPYFIGARVQNDYLRSLGIDPSVARGAPGRPPSVPPEPMPSIRGPVVVDDDARSGPGLSSETELPDGAAPKRVRAPTAAHLRAGEAARVLVALADADDRSMVASWLTDAGYRVHEARSASVASTVVAQTAIDALVVDETLPDAHAFDVCRALRADARSGHAAIVLVTPIAKGRGFAATVEASIGISEVAERPLRSSKLLEQVARALGLGPRASQSDEEMLSAASEELLARAMLAYKSGDIDGAIAHLRTAAGLEPSGFRLHYQLGLLYGRREKLYEGIHELEQAIDLRPRHFSSLKNLAVLYQRAGFKHKAIKTWERALATAPDEPTRQTIQEHLSRLL